MRGLFPLPLFAVFFYLMMRFGCGAHMVHGHHGGHEQEGHGGRSASEGYPKDPVCGMTVEPGQGYTKYQAGEVPRFCSRKCLDKFEAAPHQFLS
jgi:YHS domain-containing protein